MFQLLPYARLEDYFIAQANIPVSAGSLCNFNREAFNLLKGFEEKAKSSLVLADILHTDETSININGKKHWLHNASNDLWTLLMPHETRGTKAMEVMNILPSFEGVMVHDHWTPYADALHERTSSRSRLCSPLLPHRLPEHQPFEHFPHHQRAQTPDRTSRRCGPC